MLIIHPMTWLFVGGSNTHKFPSRFEFLCLGIEKRKVSNLQRIIACSWPFILHPFLLVVYRYFKPMTYSAVGGNDRSTFPYSYGSNDIVANILGKNRKTIERV